MKLNIRTHYPRSDEYDYETFMERINLDEERVTDINSGNGFIISAPKAVKDDIKDPDGIYSTKYGQTLQDVNAFANRYKCECGYMTQRFFHGLECPVCHKPVKFVDDNFKFFGWICLKDPYYIIHPNLFIAISFFIGEKNFMNIITLFDKKDEDGNSIEVKKPKDEPYYGIGILDFKDQFDEIMQYYLLKNPNKKDYYDDIMANRGKIFIQSIPVYTTHLRPFDLKNNEFRYEKTNAMYSMMAKVAANINNDRYKMSKKKKPKLQLIFDLQMKYKELYDEIINILKGKRGTIRANFGGRYNFTARSVIVPNPKMRIDEISLGYQCLCGLLQQVIINILHKSYYMHYNTAYKFLQQHTKEPNDIIVQIISGIIKDSGRGIPVLINRNPTIQHGGIIQMYCREISSSYTMSMPLEVLDALEADFDGDTLNIMYIINKEFLKAAEAVFNPRNVMYISVNDGEFNNSYNHQRDTLINCNTLVRLCRDRYSNEEIAIIKECVKVGLEG